MQDIDQDVIVELVQRERKVQPRLGVRKLYSVLDADFEQAGVTIGRDRLFNVLRERDLLVQPLPKAPRTTDSRHALPVFHNLVRDLEATGPNQIWVSDITYIRTDEGFEYLSLITDLFSRKIVGYYCCESLESFGCVEALRRALADLPDNCYPIHHSDRGSQYCCHEYVYHLDRRELPISMTEEDHCYENAYAERVNGILKQEHGLGMIFRSRQQARRAVDQAVWIYNNRRPHGSLNNQFPANVHGRAA